VWHWLEGQKQEANLILFPIVLPLIYFLFTFIFEQFELGLEKVFVAGLQGFFTVLFLFLGVYLVKEAFEKRNFTMGLAGVVCVWILTLAGFVFLL
ncbi:MAG: hypothetical protein GOV15_01635, partial [Candidatus Diapherotrites archaeon]|nr:hypothetical protein [Candidatus Diapherotrites archaeon]